MSKDFLALAMEIALTAHHGQDDKAGLPYIRHPMAVMEMVDTVEEKIVALLHDTIEDTDVTAKYLEAMDFPSHIVDAVVAISKVKGEKNEDYCKRVRQNPLALRVKLADIRHNMCPDRLFHFRPEVVARLSEKYRRAWNILLREDG